MRAAGAAVRGWECERARHACAARCAEPLVAKQDEPLTEDGFLKTMADLVWNHCPTVG